MCGVTFSQALRSPFGRTPEITPNALRLPKEEASKLASLGHLSRDLPLLIFNNICLRFFNTKPRFAKGRLEFSRLKHTVVLPFSDHQDPHLKCKDRRYMLGPVDVVCLSGFLFRQARPRVGTRDRHCTLPVVNARDATPERKLEMMFEQRAYELGENMSIYNP